MRPNCKLLRQVVGRLYNFSTVPDCSGNVSFEVDAASRRVIAFGLGTQSEKGVLVTTNLSILRY